MGEMEDSKNWFTRHVEGEAKKDTLSYSDRIGNIAGVIVAILVTIYFIAHHMWSTGFFTTKFGILEMLLFYGCLIYQILPSAFRVLFDRKNIVRPFETIGAVFGTVALAWFYMVFPFDFTYFADVLPGFLRFLLQWISNDIIRLLMVLGLIVAPVMAIYTAALYMFVRRELSKP